MYKVKHNTNGSMSRKKTWLVSKGYVQTYGINYEDMCSSIAKMATIKTNIALTTTKGQPSYHLDVKIVFFTWSIVKRSVHEATARLCGPNTCLGLFAS